MVPPEPSLASRAPFQLAGFPMRMGRRYRLRVRDRFTPHDGRGALRLEPHHLRQLGAPPELVVLPESAPVCRDVPGIPHRYEQVVRRVSQGVDNLEGRGLLAFYPVGIHRVYQRNLVLRGELPDQGQS